MNAFDDDDGLADLLRSLPPAPAHLVESAKQLPLALGDEHLPSAGEDPLHHDHGDVDSDHPAGEHGMPEGDPADLGLLPGHDLDPGSGHDLDPGSGHDLDPGSANDFDPGHDFDPGDWE